MLLFMLPMSTVPTPPSLPPAFSVTMTQSQPEAFIFGQFGLKPTAGPPALYSFYYDSTNADGTLRQRLNNSVGFATTVWTLFTPGNASHRVFAEFGEDCRPLPSDFTFGQGLDLRWIPNASYVGQVILPSGAKASAFGYLDAIEMFNYTAVFSERDEEFLYVDSQWMGSLPGTGSGTYPKIRHEIVPGTMHVAIPAAELWGIPVQGCFEKVPPCTEGTVEKLDVFLAHPHQFDYIDDEDTGDARGDVTFICPDILNPASGAFNLYDQVSQWRVEIDTHWGQYQQCNGYPGLCFGLEDYYVGRQIPFGSTAVPLSGQCTENADSGSWFSHTKAGRCPDGQAVASGVCSWRPLERVKTINLKCLAEEAGMRKACQADLVKAGGLPFPFSKWIWNESLPIFEAAFASDDPAKGGCPPA